VHLPITLIGASLGVWLFYVQHQFQDTFWAREKAWNVLDAAVHGSSHYDLAIILRWFTANIGSAAGYRSIVCPLRFASIPISQGSRDLHCARAFHVCA
jgi:hypothetical protein